MAETINIPKVGKVDKKWLYAGGAVIVGIVGYAYWSRGSNVEPEESSEIVDEGFPTNEYGKYVNPAPVQSVIDQTDSIKTDQEWTAAALDKMTWYEPGYLSSIIGKYLAGRGLTQEEAAVIREAWALLGRPPGKQNIISDQSGGTPSKPTSAPTNFNYSSKTDTTITFGWAGVTGAESYKIYKDSDTKTTSASSYTWTGLKANTEYTFQVAAVNAGGEGPKSSSITVRTDASSGSTAKPGQPRISVWSSGPGQIKVNITPGNPKAASYKIVDQGSAKFAGAVKSTLDNTTLTTRYLNVPKGATLYVAVRPYNAAGQVGNQSNIVRVVVKK